MKKTTGERDETTDGGDEVKKVYKKWKSVKRLAG